MAVKKRSMKGKGSYATYAAKSMREVNRNRKLKAHLKRHPEDKQASKALAKPLKPKVSGNTKKMVESARFTLRDKAGNVIPMPLFGRKED